MDFDFEKIKMEKNVLWQAMLDTMEQTRLWNEGEVPEFDKEIAQQEPSLSILPVHTGSPRGLIIICAGGAFLFKSDNEAKPVAEFFHKEGFQSAVLDYRVAPYTQKQSLLDAQRAIRYIRYHAKELNVLEDKIAIGGFSAGGMLSNLAGTFFDYGNPEAADPVNRMSSRPDAVMLCYGAFPRAAIQGLKPGFDIETQRQAALEAPETNLRFDCPPYFLFQTLEDDPRGLLYLTNQLINKGIPAEVHIFPTGAHGCGLYDGKNPCSPLDEHTSHWADLAVGWLKKLGFM